MNAANLETQVFASAVPPEPSNIPPIIHVWTHSYSNEMAGVVVINSVIGG